MPLTTETSLADAPIQGLGRPSGQDFVAGRRFQLWVQVLDQWGAPWVFSDTDEHLFRDEPSTDPHHHQRPSADRHELTVTASINANNPQGAVLWGVRTNRTIRGVLQFSTLVVSLPGTVELKFTIKTITTTAATPNGANGTPTSSSHHRDRAKDSTTTTSVTTALGLLYMSVLADPLAPGYGQGSAAACVFVFKEAVCPVYTHTIAMATSSGSSSSSNHDSSSLSSSSSLVSDAEEAEWLADFPMVRGFLPALTASATASASAYHDHYRLYLSLSCADTLTNAWAVDTEVSHYCSHDVNSHTRHSQSLY